MKECQTGMKGNRASQALVEGVTLAKDLSSLL